MAFTVQDPDTPTSDANAYVSVAAFKTHCDDRGIDYSAKTDTQIQQAIVRATDYMDGRWNYAGYKYDADQSTQCPRRDVWDEYGYYIDGLPEDLLNACHEYTKIDLIDGKVLAPNAQDNTVPGTVIRHKRKVGELETEHQYSEYKGFQKPKWPKPDDMMRQSGLVAKPNRSFGRT